jgi:hypothetical protein
MIGNGLLPQEQILSEQREFLRVDMVKDLEKAGLIRLLLPIKQSALLPTTNQDSKGRLAESEVRLETTVDL